MPAPFGRRLRELSATIPILSAKESRRRCRVYRGDQCIDGADHYGDLVVSIKDSEGNVASCTISPDGGKRF